MPMNHMVGKNIYDIIAERGGRCGRMLVYAFSTLDKFLC